MLPNLPNLPTLGRHNSLLRVSSPRDHQLGGWIASSGAAGEVQARHAAEPTDIEPP